MLGELKALISTYNAANAAVVAAGGTSPVVVNPVNPSSRNYGESEIANANAYITAVNTGASLPSFAVGTNSVPSDMLANIHQGERIIPAADNQELMQRLSSPMTQDNSELVLEIQRLNNRLATIESNTASTAGHAAKTARLLDRAMPDGDALATRTAEAI